MHSVLSCFNSWLKAAVGHGLLYVNIESHTFNKYPFDTHFYTNTRMHSPYVWVLMPPRLTCKWSDHVFIWSLSGCFNSSSCFPSVASLVTDTDAGEISTTRNIFWPFRDHFERQPWGLFCNLRLGEKMLKHIVGIPGVFTFVLRGVWF